MVKEYYAFVTPEMVDEFETQLNSRNGITKYVRKELEVGLGTNGPLVAYPYVIEAEEGIINPEWELTEEWSWLKR
jgi:hypothetical protein